MSIPARLDRRGDTAKPQETTMLKTTLTTILAAAAFGIAGLLAYAATKPDHFSVQRSTTIAAPPEKLFALINDVKAFNSWNPYALKDPAIKLRYAGAASGPGDAWESESAGVGRMEIVEAAAPNRVAMRLDFEKPMTATNRVEFTLVPQGSTTQITWAMSGAMPYSHKLMTTFFDMDKMVGSDFEAGLANLKAAAERG
jgi:uncharacterized protein YndB with AHSA1/START domain